jgi:hypothetical protein
MTKKRIEYKEEPTSSRKVKIRLYALIDDAVERGVEIGWRKAYEDVENPFPAQVQGIIADEIMAEICEVINFD